MRTNWSIIILDAPVVIVQLILSSKIPFWFPANYGVNAVCIVKYHGVRRQTMEKSGIFTSESIVSEYTDKRGELPLEEETMASKRLTIPQRKEIFQALVS